MTRSPNKFLTAEWRKLIFSNYCVDPSILLSYLPANTEIDTWNGKCFVSLVGFMFLKTKVLGFSVPFHSRLPEVNLRFYVRHKKNGEWKRGVVFIHEIVPKPALAFVANKLFKEHYLTMPMKNICKIDNNEINVSYCWKAGKWNSLEVKAEAQSQVIVSGSEAEFITEHYFGYTKFNESKTIEYEVTHPRWQQLQVLDYKVDVDFESIYGNHFQFLQNLKPTSAFLAIGSKITIEGKKTIK